VVKGPEIKKKKKTTLILRVKTHMVIALSTPLPPSPLNLKDCTL